MEGSDDKKKVYSIYPSPTPKIEYELKTLPLQNEIREVRKFACHYASIAKGNLSVVSRQISSQYSTLKGEARKYGVTSDSQIVQGCAIGGAVLLGYLIGRRKSYFRKIMYPLLSGSLVGGAFYLSVPQNRTDSNRRLQELIKRVWPR